MADGRTHTPQDSSLIECARQVIAELHVRASATNVLGQIEPPYTAPSLLAMADDLERALKQEAYGVRRTVAQWLRIRANHAEESIGLSDQIVARDRQEAMFSQLANDADHSDLLVRLLNGEEPLSWQDWQKRVNPYA